MKRSGILHGELSRIVAELGHGQLLVLGDYGLPVPRGVLSIDLALREGSPALTDVLATVLSELPVESALLASELAQTNPTYFQRLRALLHETPLEMVSHEELKAACHTAVAIVRTGEWTPYTNVVLRAGTAF
jgi:D-ribose pyranase